ncbi:hypothetical protein PHMEG_0006468 [Phytophthora megakarya]|uniref:Uncharacterized protein n=1 Tax=Phytophthora megakarya TaxID=4795 RepID=A0A225WNR0_9STRA|nr:hypothetical protein PHMEG_0006468 [Phytophthora megakarya]
MTRGEDVTMSGDSKREDEDEMADSVPPIPAGLSTPHEDEMADSVPPIPAGFSTPRRRQQKASGSFEFSVTPEPSRRRLSTSRGRQPVAGLEESPARYSPSKVKAAVRSFADFLHFLEQEEHQHDHTLMPVIIQRFAELGAVIESQKRHIDRWKGKELDLAIEEAQQNLELIRELGDTIQKQELQIAEDKVEKQKWEEKYHLAAQEVETLKKQGTYQIQQLRTEVAMLRQAGVEVEKKLKERDASLVAAKKSNDTLQSQVKEMEQNNSTVIQDNTKLKQQGTLQSDEMRKLEHQLLELREHYEAVVSKATELEQDVDTWQARYDEKDQQVRELEDALNHGRQEMGQRKGNLEQVMVENRKLQEHVNRIAQEHEKQLAEQHKYRSEVEAERQRLNQALQQESTRFQNFKKEAGAIRTQIEAQAMSAMKQREQQLLDEKARVEEELQQQFTKINEENIELRATVDSLKDINRRKSTEIGRLMATSQEAEQQNQSRTIEAHKMQQLTDEVSRAKKQFELLSKDLASKDVTHVEAMKSQSAEFETQYNDFVLQVEEQFNEMTQENEQLRANLEESAKKLEMLEGQSSAGVAELGKWRTECENFQRQLQEGARENESLKRELEHRMQELESRRKENTELSAQIEHFLSPDHERTKEVELLQSERARLEEHNRELQRLLDVTRTEANATLEEAHRIHDRSLEQESSHENTVRKLCEEKESMNHNLVTLSSEKAALESQIVGARNEIEQWKASVLQLETDKQGLELRAQDVMRQATEQIEMQKQTAAMTTEDGRTQLHTLTTQLVQREAQINEGHQQLRSLQETVRSLEEKLRVQLYEFENVKVKNEQLSIQIEDLNNEKRGVEQIMRQHSSSILRHSGVEEDLSKRFERLTREMDQRAHEENSKVMQLQAVLDSKLETQLQHSSDERAKYEEEIARLQQELENYAGELEKLDSELLQLQREREEQERAISAMQQTIATHEEEKWTQNKSQNKTPDDFKRLDTAHKELKAKYEQFKEDSMAQLREKEKEMVELQDDMTELQSKLDQEKEMTRHLMNRSHSEKQERSKEISAKSHVDTEQQAHVKQLEASVKELKHKLQISEQSVPDKRQQTRMKDLETTVKRLQHELQVSEQSMTGREQSAMHEKLQKEREQRALQTRFDSLSAENAANLKKMDAKADEIEHLREEIDQLHEEIERLHDEIRDNTTEMDNARGHLHVSEQLTLKLQEMQDDLAAREEEARQQETVLAAKEEELQHARNAERELKHRLNEKMNGKGEESMRHYKDKVREKEDEVTSLKQQNAKFREQLKRAAQAKLLSKNATETGTTARDKAMKELEEAYDQAVQREHELSSQIAHLEDAKSTMLHQFRREMRKLNIEFGSQGSNDDGSYIGDGAFHRGIMEVSALLRSYQDRETHQDTLVLRKEKQINELKSRLDELEQSFRQHDSDSKKHDEQLRGREKSLYLQVEAMNEEVSKLKLENRELRENHTVGSNDDISAEAAREWEEKCTKLKVRIRELKDANMKLKESRFSKADMKALVKEVEMLTSQVLEKDMQIKALQNSEVPKFKSTIGATVNGSHRSKDQLEEKIMVLNDHLTGLMTENMQLQHNVEQYAIQYGPLDGATKDGVIGNSGIRVPSRRNSKPAVRSR